MFSKAFIFRVIKRWDCVAKGEMNEPCSLKRQFNPLQCFKPFAKNKFKTLPKLKSLQMTIFKFDENGGKFSERVENIVGKEEIARYEQFLLFPQCF